MREGGQENWWRRSIRLAGGAIAVGATIVLAPWLLAPALAGRWILWLPADYFLFALAGPLAVLATVFWFSRRQQILDHRYDVTGNQA